MGDGVTVAHEGGTAGGHGFVVLDWEASPAADMVADAIVAVLLQVGAPKTSVLGTGTVVMALPRL